ncbi:PQQ-binding-like beta-propeller repeat protein [Tamaricihabitans halophyticus]|nr:PQQ-binding-like beta-propeller repeat protein [Tamaricihabitans halophyticus]
MRKTGLIVAILCCLGLLASACGGADFESGTAPAPKPLPDRGPVAGSYQQDWQIEPETGTERAGFQLIAGHLVVASKTGLRAYDARTGKPTWHYREPGRQLWSWATTDDAIVYGSYREEGDQIHDRQMTGLDARTGEPLWDAAEEWQVMSDGRGGSSSSPPEPGDAAAGTVLVQDGPLARAGIDARTGDVRWRIEQGDVTDECAVGKPSTGNGDSSGGKLLLAELSCKVPDQILAGIDAESGEIRWHRPIPRFSASGAVMRGGVTLLDDVREDGPPVLLGPDGSEIFTGPDGTSCSCELREAGEDVLLSYRGEGEVEPGLVRIDPRSGDVREVSNWPGRSLSEESVTVGDSLYELGDTASGGQALPMMLSVTDTAKDQAKFAHLPRTGVQPTGDLGQVQQSWFGVAGDRLYLAEQPVDPETESNKPPTIRAYSVADATEPTALGGVQPSDWPDPCAALAGVVRGEDVSTEPGGSVDIGDVTIPAVQCRSISELRSVELQVWWMSGDAKQARQLFDHMDGAGKSTVGADRELTTDEPDQVWLQVGPAIVSVGMDALDSGFSTKTREQALRKIVSNLRKS